MLLAPGRVMVNRAPVPGAAAGGGEGAAVTGNKGPGDGQPDTRAAVSPVAGGIGAVEPFEDVRQVPGGDPFPCR